MGNQFHAWAASHGVEDDTYYPYAAGGPRHLGRALTATVTVAAAIAADIGVRAAATDILHGHIARFAAQHGIDTRAAGPAAVVVEKIVDGTVTVTIVAAAILWATYMVRTVKRWRSYERNTTVNDLKALALKRRLLSAKNVKRLYKEFRESHTQKNGGGDLIDSIAGLFTQKNVGWTAKDAAFKAFLNCKVTVNTRQNLMGDDIIELTQVVFAPPVDVEASEELDKQVRGLEYVLTRVSAGNINFGARLETPDRSQWIFTARRVVADKYVLPADSGKKPVQAGKKPAYVSAFDLSCLIDHRQEIREKKAGALKWAAQAATMVDTLLATDKTQANRLNIDVGSSMALYTYVMPVSLNSTRVESITEALNSAFKTSNADVSAQAGDLCVTVPLPKQFKLPIDVASMYREAFF